MDNDQNV